MIVIHWLASPAARWNTFVRNRVAKIQDMTSIHSWRHTAGENNPADLVSRGLNGDQLVAADIWWQGPVWLSQNDNYWQTPIELQAAESLPEEKEQVIVTLHNKPEQENVINTLIQRHSSFTRLIRTLAHCKRFIMNCRTNLPDRNTNPLGVDELNLATQLTIAQVQGECFNSELDDLHKEGTVARNSKLLSLSPFLDKDNLIRVGGRLENAQIRNDHKHPLILPARHKLSELIIIYEHQRLLHAGPQGVLSSVRQKYWPIDGRNLSRRIVRTCIRCFKAKPVIPQQLMGQLPAQRVRPSRPFLFTGVDYCGPFLIKSSTRRKAPVIKSYVSVFVCFSTKALHLELVEDMTTPTFLNAVHRFTSRRGKPIKIYSDNGSNFIGASNIIRINHLSMTEDKDHVGNSLCSEGIEWSFMPPAAPHFGSLWESGVRQVKFHLKRVINNTVTLTFSEFYTILTKIEACINSRPLLPLSSDPSDLHPLTPAHFLIGGPMTEVPEPDVSLLPTNRLNSYQRLQALFQSFWKRWSAQYLSELQVRSRWKKKQPNLQVGSLVIIRNSNLPPMSWKMGRIIQTHAGADGLVRVATIRTKNGEMKRPITKLCPLPVDQEPGEECYFS